MIRVRELSVGSKSPAAIEKGIWEAMQDLKRPDNKVKFIQIYREQGYYNGIFEVTAIIPEPTMQELHEYEEGSR